MIVIGIVIMVIAVMIEYYILKFLRNRFDDKISSAILTIISLIYSILTTGQLDIIVIALSAIMLYVTFLISFKIADSLNPLDSDLLFLFEFDIATGVIMTILQLFLSLIIG